MHTEFVRINFIGAFDSGDNFRMVISSIEHIEVDDEYSRYYNEYLESIKIPSSIELIPEKYFIDCSSLTSIEYEGEIDGNCIQNCKALRIIPKIKSLEISNFEQCVYLTSVDLKQSIKKIPLCCFNQCV